MASSYLLLGVQVDPIDDSNWLCCLMGLPFTLHHHLQQWLNLRSPASTLAHRLAVMCPAQARWPQGSQFTPLTQPVSAAAPHPANSVRHADAAEWQHLRSKHTWVGPRGFMPHNGMLSEKTLKHMTHNSA